MMQDSVSSVNDPSSLGASNRHGMPNMNSVTDLPKAVENSRDARVDDPNNSVDFGLPQTEDAENIPTMAQLSLNFGGSNANAEVDQHTSMRSGVFGGMNQSGASENPSFRDGKDYGVSVRTNAIVNKQKLDDAQ